MAPILPEPPPPCSGFMNDRRVDRRANVSPDACGAFQPMLLRCVTYPPSSPSGRKECRIDGCWEAKGAGETAGAGKQLALSAADSHKEPKKKEELQVKALMGSCRSARVHNKAHRLKYTEMDHWSRADSGTHEKHVLITSPSN